MKRIYGLIGHPLSHSFSPPYFNRKFSRENIDAEYRLFDMADIDDFEEILDIPGLSGLNVTIPYKTEIMGYIHVIDKEAASIGAVNTIRIKDDMLTGFNTDVYGFLRSLKNWLGSDIPPALVLGTGGAARSVIYGLKSLDIPHLTVSRNPEKGNFTYETLHRAVTEDYPLIINTTPAGMYPDTDNMPAVDPELITEKTKVFDLIYNPSETRLMKLAASKGADVKNGLEMLELQAEKSWEIWNQ